VQNSLSNVLITRSRRGTAIAVGHARLRLKINSPRRRPCTTVSNDASHMKSIYQFEIKRTAFLRRLMTYTAIDVKCWKSRDFRSRVSSFVVEIPICLDLFIFSTLHMRGSGKGGSFRVIGLVKPIPKPTFLIAAQ